MRTNRTVRGRVSVPRWAWRRSCDGWKHDPGDTRKAAGRIYRFYSYRLVVHGWTVKPNEVHGTVRKLESNGLGQIQCHRTRRTRDWNSRNEEHICGRVFLSDSYYAVNHIFLHPQTHIFIRSFILVHSYLFIHSLGQF